MAKSWKDWLKAHEGEALELLKTIAAIPAPSGHEEQRAAFVKEWLEKQIFEGGTGTTTETTVELFVDVCGSKLGKTTVFVDEALNVVLSLGDDGAKPLDVYMAHTDVVFPDTAPLPVRIEGERIMAPGVGDDTANLVALLMAAKFIVTEKPALPSDRALLLAANSGEEGLGNLKGSRQICAAYGPRIHEFVSFDGTCKNVVGRAVGSRRYSVTVKTEGGHSFANFGNNNAIAHLASLITALYGIKVPAKGKTTFNVGTITGGTSVNTIAQDARMLYEFRSDEQTSLAFMEKHFRALVKAFQSKGITVETELVGERPCTGKVNAAAHQKLLKRGQAAIEAHTGKAVPITAASTDANIPLSLGISAITLGCYLGQGAHTREEWLDLPSWYRGMGIAFEMILGK